jgi:metallo-beta-lactamase class B
MKPWFTVLNLVATQFIAVSAFAITPGRLELIKLTDRIYVAEDYFYFRENSAVYIGDSDVTVISATWTPETAKLLVDKVRQITKK